MLQVSFVPQRERTYRMQLPIVVKALAGPAPDFRDAGQIGTRLHTHQPTGPFRTYIVEEWADWLSGSALV